MSTGLGMFRTEAEARAYFMRLNEALPSADLDKLRGGKWDTSRDKIPTVGNRPEIWRCESGRSWPKGEPCECCDD